MTPRGRRDCALDLMQMVYERLLKDTQSDTVLLDPAQFTRVAIPTGTRPRRLELLGTPSRLRGGLTWYRPPPRRTSVACVSSA